MGQTNHAVIWNPAKIAAHPGNWHAVRCVNLNRKGKEVQEKSVLVGVGWGLPIGLKFEIPVETHPILETRDPTHRDLNSTTGETETSSDENVEKTNTTNPDLKK